VKLPHDTPIAAAEIVIRVSKKKYGRSTNSVIISASHLRQHTRGHLNYL